MLGVPKTKRKQRTLSVVRFSDLEKSKMDSSIDQLTSLVKQVKRNWKISAQENTNPLEIALPLLDNTSVGMAYRLPDFRNLSEKISQSLQVAVNEHYQTFNNSVGSYDVVCDSINESQKTVKHVKETLKQISSDITSKNEVLSKLNEDSKQFGDMVEILSAIEEFLSLPARIDNLFADKKFNKIEELISEAELMSETYKLSRIPALDNTRSYLAQAKQNLFDFVLEELNHTIYLKTKSQVLLNLVMNKNETLSANNMMSEVIEDFSNLELYINNVVNIDVLEKSSIIRSKLDDFLRDLERKKGIKLSDSVQADYENNPYSYIHLLLNTLAKLNKLPKALELLSQRHPSELHKIVSETAEDIKLKHPNLNKKIAVSKTNAKSVKKVNSSEKSKSQSKEIGAHKNDFDENFGLSIGNLNNIVLQDFFWQIFTKFLLVLQAHRVVFEISKNISDMPEDQFVSKLSSYSFIEIWKNISSEVRSLMYSYITNDAVVFSDAKNNNIPKDLDTPANHLFENWNTNLLFDQKKKNNSLRSATLFQFNEDLSEDEKINSQRSLNDLHSEELKNFLQEVFPGFKINEALDTNIGNDSDTLYLENIELSKQETLVPANVFNMRVILDAFLMFIQGSKGIFPKVSSEPIDFFNNFMKKTFLPQLEETLDYIYDNTVNNDSFALESLSSINETHGVIEGSSDVKVFKSAVDFYNMLSRICQVLNTSLKYREEYSSLIIQLIYKFFSKYEELYTELLPNIDQQVLNVNNNYKQLNRWLKSPELSHLSLQIVNGKKDSKLLVSETDMLLKGGDKLVSNINKTQFLHAKNFDTLVHLLSTLDWILKWLPEMKKLMEDIENSMSHSNSDISGSVLGLKSNWEFLEPNQTKVNNLKRVKLIFDAKSPLMSQFDTITNNFEKLLCNTLLALRYDVRIRLIYHTSAALNNNDWCPNSDINSICPEIKDLTSLLQLLHRKFTSDLNSDLGYKIIYGIPNVIDRLFIIGSRFIKALNNYGIRKIYLNIITIQQSLRGLMASPEEVDFTNSLAYFDLFKKGNDNVIAQYKNGSIFDLEESKNMVRLIFSQEFKEHEKDHAPPLLLNKRYNDCIRELEGI